MGAHRRRGRLLEPLNWIPLLLFVLSSQQAAGFAESARLGRLLVLSGASGGGSQSPRANKMHELFKELATLGFNSNELASALEIGSAATTTRVLDSDSFGASPAQAQHSYEPALEHNSIVISPEDLAAGAPLDEPEMLKNNHQNKMSNNNNNNQIDRFTSSVAFGPAQNSRLYSQQHKQRQQQQQQQQPSYYFAPPHYSHLAPSRRPVPKKHHHHYQQQQQQQQQQQKYQYKPLASSLSYMQALQQSLGKPQHQQLLLGGADHAAAANQLVSTYISASSALSGSLGAAKQDSLRPLEGNSIDAAETPLAELAPPSADTCGRQRTMATAVATATREPRIVGGNSTYEGEFPWAVSIQRHGNHHCGGVIIARRWILTAAHCVRSQLVGNLLVRTGGHTLQQRAAGQRADYAVDQIIMHDDFNRFDNLQPTQVGNLQSVASGASVASANMMKSAANTANNADIALLKLTNEIQLDEHAWPVCFPGHEAGNFSGHDAIVIGWGKLSEKSEEFSNELQKVKLTIIDNKVCQNWFRQAGREMPIDERIICAGFKQGGKDACHGDSGGPLLSRMASGQFAVVGVVSTGIGCARPLLPGLYSRVSSYIGWIEAHIAAPSS